MRASTVLLALAGSASATKEFTRMVFPQGLMARTNDTETGYKPQVTACGKGTTCAEACGAGYEMCTSSDKKAHCYNPAAGEACCSYGGVGTSCDTGYFCAHVSSNHTNSVCCSSDSSLDQCAVKNNIVSGALASDPPATTTTTSSSSSSTSIPLTTSVHTTNSTTHHHLSTAYLVNTASSGWAPNSANATSYTYSASAAPTTTADIADATATHSAADSVGAAGSAAAAATTKSKTSSSSSSAAVPIAALALVAGAFATFF